MVSLSAHMVIMLSDQYLGRFWPQWEAFLSFQTITNQGLQPSVVVAPDSERAYVMIMDATCLACHERERLRIELFARWQFADLEQAIHALASPELQVTSGQDKVEQIAKLIELRKDLTSAVAHLTECLPGAP